MAGALTRRSGAVRPRAVPAAAKPVAVALDLASLLDGRFDRLSAKLAEAPANATFSYRGFLFGLQVEASDRGTRMRVHAHLGNLPYSAESGFARVNASAIVEAAGRALGGRVVVSPHQRIFLIEEKMLRIRSTPTDLVSETVRLILEVWPYLELLSVVIPPPMAVRHRFTGGRPGQGPEA